MHRGSSDADPQERPMDPEHQHEICTSCSPDYDRSRSDVRDRSVDVRRWRSERDQHSTRNISAMKTIDLALLSVLGMSLFAGCALQPDDGSDESDVAATQEITGAPVTAEDLMHAA